MTRIRKNYIVLYQTLVRSNPDKKKECKTMFRKKCDCCKKIRYTTAGNVFEFSFYCEECCITIQPQKCSECLEKDILVSRKCLVCFNEERKKKMPKSIVDRYYRECHRCGEFGFILRFNDGKKGICVNCLEKPIACSSCGRITVFFSKMCTYCHISREKVLANNPYYFLTMYSDS